MSKKPCPYCAESIPAGAQQCPQCGESLGGPRRGGEGPPAEGRSSKSIVLIVVAVLALGMCGVFGIIAAIAVPNLIQARKHGNEAMAIGALKTMSTAQVLFREGDKDDDKVLDYGDLDELGATNLIDPVLASGLKGGYAFECAPGDEREYTWMAVANPIQPGKTGDRAFATNHTGVIYYVQGGPIDLRRDCEMPPGARPVGR